VDMDGSGLLNFPEFLAMMGYKVGDYIFNNPSKAKYSSNFSSATFPLHN